MKILYVVFEALLGGHVLSAMTTAKEMQANGHYPLFAARTGRMTPVIKNLMPFFHIDIPMHHKGRQTYFTWSSFHAVQQLRTIIQEEKIDLIHAFDTRSYMHGYLASLLDGVPIICTLCGGVDPYYNIPKSPKLIVFSDEQKMRMINKWGWESGLIEVIRNRLDTDKLQNHRNLLNLDDLGAFGIDTTRPLLMMITRFDDLQVGGIPSLIEAVAQLRVNLPLQLVFIGGSKNPDSEPLKMAKALNQKYNDDTVVMIDTIEDAFRFLKYASIVFGVGRSAFEGMYYAKPTIILGNNGYAGTVGEDDIDNLAYYNFSGRNQKELVSSHVFAKKISDLISNEELRNKLGDFAKKYIEQELDVTKGIARINKMYEIVTNMRRGRFISWCSFIKCLIPIAIDNGLYKPKVFIKKYLKKYIQS